METQDLTGPAGSFMAEVPNLWVTGQYGSMAAYEPGHSAGGEDR